MTWTTWAERSPYLQVCKRSSISETRPHLWQVAPWPAEWSGLGRHAEH